MVTRFAYHKSAFKRASNNLKTLTIEGLCETFEIIGLFGVPEDPQLLLGVESQFDFGRHIGRITVTTAGRHSSPSAQHVVAQTASVGPQDGIFAYFCTTARRSLAASELLPFQPVQLRL